MSNDEYRDQEPNFQEEPEEKAENPEPVEEAQGSPVDPALLDEVAEAEEPGTEELEAEEPEVVEEEALDQEPESVQILEQEDLPALREELEMIRVERDDYLNSLRRLKAEFENSRKRHERERLRVLEMASERLVSELLPVLDNLDRALESEGNVREGVKATRNQLLAVLSEEGLAPVASDGQHFDPNVHEAVMGQPSEEHEEGTILQTFERGYLLNGKPIRPAKVVVAR